MSLLTEDKRSELLAKSRQSAQYKGDQSKGKNRFERRLKSRMSHSVKEYNSMDMDKFFKKDILDVSVKVQGETDTYLVRMSFGGVADNLKDQIEKNNGEFNLRIIIRALIESFNRNDVYIHCECDDWKYRHAYWATVGDINSGEPQHDPGKGIANPNNDMGPGCKHTMLLLANNTWLIKVASVIFNYVNYMELHSERLYADYIYPKIFGKEYEKDVQLDLPLDDTDNLDSDSDTIDTSNKWARTKNQFKQGNTQGIRFTSNQPDKQLNLDSLLDDEEDIEEEEEG